jgi:hypothetical protein
MSDKDVIELVEEAKKPGVFNIINAINNRAYPSDSVTVYLDEQTAYEASEIQDKITELDKRMNGVDPVLFGDLDKELSELKKQRDALVQKLEKNKYTFVIRGISEGQREDLLEKASEEFPIEYEENKNPFSGEVNKKEIDNKKRDRLFTNLLWVEHITKIVDAEGNEQEAISLEEVEELRRSLPIAAIGNITNAIEKLRIATATFMFSVDEDFLAKS